LSWKGPVLPVLAVGLFAPCLSADPALSDAPARERTHELGSKSVGDSPERFKSTKPPARKPKGKPDRNGNFIHEIINNIRAQSEELCARYGSPTDCLEEAEVCLTMRDNEDNTMRLCLNTVPGESDRDKVQKLRLRP
jgi:hypothetical protein